MEDAMSAEATTDQAPAQPMLRIEAGQHTAMIGRLDLDREGRYLVTGSDDKTARVWALPEGRLLRVLRPPAGPGNEGMVYAVAITPDGATAALGGFDVEWEASGHSIYLFDREVGRMLRRLGGFQNVVNHLAFSPGGEYLAAALGAGNGLRVWETRDWEEIFEDLNYGSDSYGCAFDRAGRLVTTCYDGLLRLYGPAEKGRGFRLLRKTPAPGGGQPVGIAFSPGGERLAIGYHDTTDVSVLSGADLSHLFSPDTTHIKKGDLSSVAWSADGRFLCAGGRYIRSHDSSSVFPILRWAEAGRGECTALAAAGNTLMDLKPWGEAGVLFAAADPRFGGFDGDGAKRLDRGPETADLRDKLGGALIASRDGRSVRFGLGVGEEQPVRFDLDRRQVTAEAPADPALTPARTEAKDLTLEGWQNTTEPRLNGEPLALKPYEKARSLALAPGGERFLLGTEWRLRLFDRKGIQLWRQAAPGAAWGVNIPTGGMLAIAAYGDGTIRWHRLEDGEALLALFVHPDGRRWIAWTPQGYYDASAGADGLIGWQVNRGRDQAADFFPVWQFRQRFYRPDVVSRVLDTLDVAEALREADAAADRKTQPADARLLLRENAPPTIDLLTPKDGAAFDKHEITVGYLLRHAAGLPQGELWAVIGGRPEPVSPRKKERTQEAEVCEVTLWLPPQDVTVALEVRIGDLSGRSPAIQLHWRGVAPEPRPTLYVLAVGVSEYKHYKPLRYAHLDAKDLAEAMRGQQGLMYERVEARTLPNDEATCAEIMAGLQWLTEQAKSADVAIVFLSGHGLTDRRGSYYFLPHNFELSNLWGTSVPQEMLEKFLKQIEARKRIVLVDSCHAGGAADGGAAGGAGGQFEAHVNIDRFANELAHATGVVVLTSSTGTQESIEHEDWQNGAFTEALLEGLAGKADYESDRVITMDELNLYLPIRVKKLTGGRQTPQRAISGTDFPIARVPS